MVWSSSLPSPFWPPVEALIIWALYIQPINHFLHPLEPLMVCAWVFLSLTCHLFTCLHHSYTIRSFYLALPNLTWFSLSLHLLPSLKKIWQVAFLRNRAKKRTNTQRDTLTNGIKSIFFFVSGDDKPTKQLDICITWTSPPCVLLS